jgi:hypothetical protein
MTAEQAARIDKAARECAERWLAGQQLPESVQRRIRPLLTTARARAA